MSNYTITIEEYSRLTEIAIGVNLEINQLKAKLREKEEFMSGLIKNLHGQHTPPEIYREQSGQKNS